MIPRIQPQHKKVVSRRQKKKHKYHENIGGREELNLTAGKCALLAAEDRRPPRDFVAENILRQFVSMLVYSTIYIYMRDEIKIGKNIT